MSADTGMKACCLSGKVQEGTPKGKEITVGGLQTYVAEPEDGSKARSIIFLPDAFGWTLPNTRLLADLFASKGFYCYVPDVQEGDYLEEELMTDVEPPLAKRETQSLASKAASAAKVTATLYPWAARRREAVSRPIIEGFIQTVRMTPYTDKVGVIGFCWGARYAILAAQEKDPNKAIDAAFGAHPSLTTPADYEAVIKPLALALGEKDSYLNGKDLEKVQEVVEKLEAPHEIKIYDDQVHGFALRGDWSSDKDKEAMDQAANQAVEWFKKYLA